MLSQVPDITFTDLFSTICYTDPQGPSIFQNDTLGRQGERSIGEEHQETQRGGKRAKERMAQGDEGRLGGDIEIARDLTGLERKPTFKQHENAIVHPE